MGIAALAAPPAKAAEAEYDDVSVGSATAPVKVVLYFSPAAAHCGQWFEEVYDAFKARYIDPGIVYFSLRELIAGDRALARAGIFLARCAGRNRYIEVVRAVSQRALRSSTWTVDPPSEFLEPIARRFALTADQIQACSGPSQERELAARLHRNFRLYRAVGVPTFLVNGTAFDGFRDLNALDPIIAAAIKADRDVEEDERQRQ